MRIRKHAKKIAESAVYTNGSGHSPYPQVPLLRCQLNQSPWDIITFPPDSSSSSHPPPPPPPPPPPFQVDEDDRMTGNGSSSSTLGDSIGAVESVASMKMSLGDDEEDDPKHGPAKGLKDEEMEEEDEDEEEELGLGNGNGNGKSNMCCKTDGKGWQCRREAREGNSMCSHHLNQLRNYNNLAHPSSSSAAAARRPRAKKPSSTTTAASNPYEFYYYSGFGPRWGKKRGETRLELDNAEIDNAELDYDDDDDEEEEVEVEGKKRARKPIKARSLKSLM